MSFGIQRNGERFRFVALHERQDLPHIDEIVCRRLARRHRHISGSRAQDARTAHRARIFGTFNFARFPRAIIGGHFRTASAMAPMAQPVPKSTKKPQSKVSIS